VLAEINADAGFRPGLLVTVAGGLYQVSPGAVAPGGDLAAIAQHFQTTVEDVRSANAAGGSLPNTLAPYTAIKLPAVVVASDGNSFRKLSAYYGAPVAGIAAANLDVAGIFQDVRLTVVTGPLSLATVAKQGVAGMTLVRPAPQVPVKIFDGVWAEQYLLQNFGLLGYRVADNPQNHYFSTSERGLPSGPIAPEPMTMVIRFRLRVLRGLTISGISASLSRSRRCSPAEEAMSARMMGLAGYCNSNWPGWIFSATGS